MQRRDWLKWTAGAGAAGLPLLAAAQDPLPPVRRPPGTTTTSSRA